MIRAFVRSPLLMGLVAVLATARAGVADETLTLTGGAPTLYFNDSLPTTRQWSLTGMHVGFSVRDETNVSTPFWILPGAAGNSIVVDTNKRIGFGTGSPQRNLHVVDSVNSPTLRLEDTFGGDDYAWDLEGSQVGFSLIDDAAGAAVTTFRVKPGAPQNSLVVSGNGRVGFGTNNPTAHLHVFPDGATDAKLRLEVNNPSLQAWELNGNASAFTLIDASSAEAPLRVNFGAPQDSLAVSGDGDIGMGTNNPQARLHVFPVDQFHANLRLETPAGGGGIPNQAWDLAGNAGGFSLTDVTHSMVQPFAVAPSTPTYTMYLANKGSGMVGVGTSSPDLIGSTLTGGNARHINLDAGTGIARNIVQGQLGAEFYMVHKGGSANRKIVRFGVNGGKYRVACLTDNLQGNTEAAAFCIDMTTTNVGIKTPNPTKPLQVGDTGANDGNGAHVTAGGVWTNASSRTVKDRIADLPLDEARQTVRALQPVTYHYKNETDEQYVGFIAEDVPELVATKDRKSLAPMDVVAVLTKVVQEQERQIEEQNKRLARLERLLESRGLPEVSGK